MGWVVVTGDVLKLMVFEVLVAAMADWLMTQHDVVSLGAEKNMADWLWNQHDVEVSLGARKNIAG